MLEALRVTNSPHIKKWANLIILGQPIFLVLVTFPPTINLNPLGIPIKPTSRKKDEILKYTVSQKIR
ncbi:MAG: hypothetical protein A4E53_04603 [Pelotomaculum sp. PtaB.Bin104]|nr:MAG: hypothetical protein A4E53_04603 [Pelotomaculum sp. PtaB.Bin104]